MRRDGWRVLAVLLLLLGSGLAAAPALAQQAVPAPARDGATLERVRQAGLLRCGVATSGGGLAILDEQGQWRGFFVEMCRALAAAAVGSTENVEFTEATSENRFSVLRKDSLDVVMLGTTWTLQRDATQGVDFPVVYLFDGQGVMAHRSLGAKGLAEVKDGTICVIEGTTTLHNLELWIERTHSGLTVKPLRSTEGALSAFFNRHCDLFTNDRISLYAQLLSAPHGEDYIVFPDVISKEPLGPMVRAGDRRWSELVRWVVLAMVLAEEKGVTAANLESMKASPDPEVQRLLGVTPGVGQMFGLDDQWAARVIAQIGNYGEVFERNLGKGSPLKIDRGLNALWTDGGLHFAPPLGW